MTYFLPPVETWKDWSAIFSDTALWRPVVAEICSREGIACSNIEAGYPGTNAVYVIDRTYVVKVYNPVWEDFGVERDLHTILGRGNKVPIPSLVSSGQFVDRIEWDYLITEFAEGTPIRELRDCISQYDLIEIARHLGEIVRALHETDVSRLENLKQHETGLQLAHRRKSEIVKEMRDKKLLADNVVDEMESFVEASVGLGRDPFVLVHGDLTEDHLLLKRQAGKWAITALLDFGDARLCPREYDWPALWLDLLRRNTSTLRAFFEAYDRAVLEDEDFIRRAFVWTLFHDFGTGIVEDQLKRHDAEQVRSVDDLRELMWPSDIFAA